MSETSQTFRQRVKLLRRFLNSANGLSLVLFSLMLMILLGLVVTALNQ